jgi:hypothetical protein
MSGAELKTIKVIIIYKKKLNFIFKLILYYKKGHRDSVDCVKFSQNG